MKKVLIYGNRKQDDDIWDVSTPELLDKACLELFNILNAVWCVYDYLPLVVGKKRHCVDCDGNGTITLKSGSNVDCPSCAGPYINTDQKKSKERELELYNKAIQNDAKAAYELLKLRKTYEYEEWNIYNVKS